MALHLNLYHEIQQAQLEARRDPLKIGLYVLVFIGLCFVGYYVYRRAAVSKVTAQVATLRSEWVALEAKEKLALTRDAELSRSIEVATAMENLIENRFYWAPILEVLGRLTPAEVQLTKITGESRVNDQCLLTINGVSSGPEPRTVAEDLRTELSQKLGKFFSFADASFVSLEDGEQMVQLAGKTHPTSVFTIRLELRGRVDPAQAAAKEAAAASAAPGGKQP